MSCTYPLRAWGEILNVWWDQDLVYDMNHAICTNSITGYNFSFIVQIQRVLKRQLKIFSVGSCWMVRLLPNFFDMVSLCATSSGFNKLPLASMENSGTKPQSCKVKELSKQGWHNSSVNMADKYCTFWLNRHFFDFFFNTTFILMHWRR